MESLIDPVNLHDTFCPTNNNARFVVDGSNIPTTGIFVVVDRRLHKELAPKPVEELMKVVFVM